VKPIGRGAGLGFNWQITYMYKDPLKLPKGSNLSLTAHY